MVQNITLINPVSACVVLFLLTSKIIQAWCQEFPGKGANMSLTEGLNYALETINSCFV